VKTFQVIFIKHCKIMDCYGIGKTEEPIKFLELILLKMADWQPFSIFVIIFCISTICKSKSHLANVGENKR